MANRVNPLLESFLRRHRDRETAMTECCGTAIPDLTMRQVGELLRAETGVEVSRQWLIHLLERFQIPRRGKPGPPGDPLKKKLGAQRRYIRWKRRQAFIRELASLMDISPEQTPETITAPLSTIAWAAERAWDQQAAVAPANLEERVLRIEREMGMLGGWVRTTEDEELG